MIRRIILSLCFVATCFSLMAQGNLKAYAEYDYYRTNKKGFAMSVVSDYQLADNFNIGLGFQASATNRYAIDLRGQVNFLKVEKGRLYVENRYLYRIFPSYGIQEFNALLDIGWQCQHFNVQLGLCNRYTADIPLRNEGGMGTIFEPMNVMFNVQYHVFRDDHRWNIGLGISNQHDFMIERFTLFFYTIDGYFNINDNWQLLGDFTLHPCGVLNLSAQFDGFRVKFGFNWMFNRK